MRKILHLILMAAAVTLAVSCNNGNKEEEKPEATEPAPFAKGADIGWATEMADDGIKFYNAAGEERECTALMKELGLPGMGKPSRGLVRNGGCSNQS